EGAGMGRGAAQAVGGQSPPPAFAPPPTGPRLPPPGRDRLQPKIVVRQPPVPMRTRGIPGVPPVLGALTDWRTFEDLQANLNNLGLIPPPERRAGYQGLAGRSGQPRHPTNPRPSMNLKFPTPQEPGPAPPG